jgi:lipopolysaccharide transport system permease protein
MITMWRKLYTHRQLVWQLVQREVIGRYRGSVLGLFWTFLHPLFMLGIYTFVFSVVFTAKWGERINSKSEFAIILFTGLIIFNLFAETIGRAPGLILANTNYVKKVVFPLEVLPVVSVFTALFHGVVSVLVLLGAKLLFDGTLPVTIVAFPLVVLPLVVLILGLSWFLAGLGVYLRDVTQTIGIALSALMFVSPIFFPLNAIPVKYRPFMQLNPLTFIIEQSREVLLFGHWPAWMGLGIYGVAGLTVAWFGWVWFEKTRRGFADVL